MKKFLLIGGGVALVLVIVAAAFFYRMEKLSEELQPEALSWVDRNIPPILSSWSPDELLQRASPKLKAIASPEQIATLFSQLTDALGVMKRYNGAKGNLNIVASPGGMDVSAIYLVSADFEQAPAQILVGLERDGDRWLITDFQLHSDGPAK